MPEPKDIQSGIDQALIKVAEVFSDLEYPEDWKTYFFAKASQALLTAAIKEAVKN